MKTPMIYFSVILYCSFLSFSVSAAADQFDSVCGYFKELSMHPSVNTMSNLQRNDYITEKLNRLPVASDARIAWEAIASAMPNQRYELYRSSARSILNRNWECKPMSKLASQTGAF